LEENSNQPSPEAHLINPIKVHDSTPVDLEESKSIDSSLEVIAAS
jgi:hypothetical protein